MQSNDDDTINSPTNNFTTSSNYIATVKNGICEFSRKPKEDAIVWLRDAILIPSLVDYSENEILRILILKMKEAALSWASKTFQNHNGLSSLEEFTTLFKKKIQ